MIDNIVRKPEHPTVEIRVFSMCETDETVKDP